MQGAGVVTAGTQIARRANGIPPLDLDPLRIAAAFKASGMFPDLQSEAQAVVKIVAGQEVGFGPMASMQSIQMIQGRPTFSANALSALVKMHPTYNYRVVAHDATVCRIEFLENGELTGVSEFTMEDAQRAGLVGGTNWKKYPKAMLFARALSQGVRWYAPDVTAGSAAYVPEELGGDEPQTAIEAESRDAHAQSEALAAEAGHPEVEQRDSHAPRFIDAERVETIANGFRVLGLKIREIDELLAAAGLSALRARSPKAVMERLAELTPEEADKLEVELEREAEKAS